MMSLRLRTRTSKAELEEKVGKIVTPADANVLLTGACEVRKPDGTLLCKYLPGAVRQEMQDAYVHLAKVRGSTDNRGPASGVVRVVGDGAKRTRTKAIMSSVLGGFDPYGRDQFCRLTAFTAQNPETWGAMLPLYQRIGALFAEHVPERYAAQMDEVGATHPDWIIDGTPFTTITINNTYPTGVHTDKGDLDKGFSCLAVHRRGRYTGGVFTFPEFRVAVDLQDGDLILMDAHEWHGNTMIACENCGEHLDKPRHVCHGLAPDTDWPSPERISVVAYYRTKMTRCQSMPEENAKRTALVEARNVAHVEG